MARFGSKNVSCSAKKSKKLNPTLNIGEKGEVNCCEKSAFPKVYAKERRKKKEVC